MKYCEFCGNEIDDNSSFCSSCGKKIIEEKNVYFQEKEYEANNNKNILIIAALVILITVIFVYWVIKEDVNNTANQGNNVNQENIVNHGVAFCKLDSSVTLRSATIQINDRIIYLNYKYPLPTKGYIDEHPTYYYVVGRSANGTFQDNVDVGWIRTETLIEQLKNSFGMQVATPEYNPDYLMAPGSEEFIRLYDTEGIILSTIYVYNRQNVSLSQKDCDAVETYWNTDTDMDYSKVINKYGYFFGGINVFSGEWDYDKVKNEIAKETGEYTVNESNDGEYFLVTVVAYNVGSGYWYGYDDTDWYGTHEDELHKYDSGIIYRFYFDPVTRMLVSMDVN